MTTKEIRQAATVIVARAAEDGVEVLALRRGKGSRFLPGYLVFPGGAVDPEDAVLADRWFETADERARACAARELAEEAGLLLTGDGLCEAEDDQWIRALDAAPPEASQLSLIAHWVAPEDVPVRFDARYFAVEAPGGLVPKPDGHEADEAWWVRPSDAMREWAAGRERLYWPTMKTMEALARCRSVGEVLALDIPEEDPEEGDEGRMPRSTFYQDGE